MRPTHDQILAICKINMFVGACAFDVMTADPEVQEQAVHAFDLGEAMQTKLVPLADAWLTEAEFIMISMASADMFSTVIAGCNGIVAAAHRVISFMEDEDIINFNREQLSMLRSTVTDPTTSALVVDLFAELTDHMTELAKFSPHLTAMLEGVKA